MLREVSLFRVSKTFCISNKKGNSSGKRSLSLWISEGDSFGTREPHVVCSCVFPREEDAQRMLGESVHLVEAVKW